MSVRLMSQVFDSDLRPTVRFVALALADYANDEGRSIYPSVADLRAKTGLADRTIRSALAELQATGLLVKEGGKPGRRGGRPIPVWRLLAPQPAARTGSPQPAADAGPNRQQMPPQPAGAADGTTSEPPGGTTSKNPRARGANPRAIGDVTQFERFWAVYPRKAGKGAARNAFAKARLRHPVDLIVQAAQAFADDPNREPAYTPHPATWLNQERWGDDPLPARGGKRDPAADLLREAAEEGYGRHTGEGGAGHLPGPVPGAGGATQHAKGVGGAAAGRGPRELPGGGEGAGPIGHAAGRAVPHQHGAGEGGGAVA